MKDLITKIVSLLKPSYIYKVGSSLICTNPNDVDLVLIYDNHDKMIEASKKKNSVFTQDDLNIDGIQYNLLFNSLEYIYNTASLYAYEFGPYLIQLYGNNNIMQKLNILTDINLKKEACCIMASQIHIKMSCNFHHGSYISKPYRLLLTCYILYNNSFELSEEQKDIINKVHDEKTISNELLTWCKQVVDKERSLLNDNS